MIPIYLLSYNRLDSLNGMVEFLKCVPNAHVVICDNASSYPPLIDWLAACDVEVRYLSNLGHRGLWQHHVIPLGSDHRKRFGSDWYVVSDPDLDLGGCPLDLLEVLTDGLSKYPQMVKVGLGLETNDLPDHYPHKDAVQKWESQFWARRHDDRFFRGGIDTTFAVYHCDRPYVQDAWIAPALRADRPYVARHVPWYVDFAQLNEEETFFLEHIERITHWSHANLRAMRRIPEPT